MDIYEIISKYLTGESSEAENNELANWRKLNGENEKVFQELRESWELANGDAPSPYYPDKEKVWNRITTNIKQVKMTKTYTRRLLIRTASIAAMFALIIGFSVSLLFTLTDSKPEENITFRTRWGEKAEISLPDGSVVLLNSGSTLTYNTDYNFRNRKVRLEGQAFFDVAKDTRNPFTVGVGNIQINVHGTAFDVNGYKEDASIEVSLLRGHVSIANDQGNLLADMRPDQKAIIRKDDFSQNRLIACNADTESVWRYNKLKIENEPLETVLHKMERWYGVHIQLSGSPKHKHYWLTIKTESLTEMLEVINKITPIDYKIDGEEVNISYK